MQQRKVPTIDFKRETFEKEILSFLEKVISPGIHPSALIMTMETIDRVPEFGPEEGIKNLWEILETGNLLFFPFSETNVGEPIRCADGQKRRVEDDSEITIGEIDCVGFLFQLKEGVFYINSAIHDGGMCPGPLPSIDIKWCDCFDSGMETFIDRFIMP